MRIAAFLLLSLLPAVVATIDWENTMQKILAGLVYIMCVSAVSAQDNDVYYRTHFYYGMGNPRYDELIVKFYRTESTGLVGSFPFLEIASNQHIELVDREYITANDEPTALFEVTLTGKDTIQVYYGMHVSAEDAEIITVDRMGRTNLYFWHLADMETPYTIDDNGWTASGFKPVIFIRNNVRIWIDHGRCSPEAIIYLAECIDGALQNSPKTDTVDDIPFPVIQTIEPVYPVSGTPKVKIRGMDPSGTIVRYRMQADPLWELDGIGILPEGASDKNISVRCWAANRNNLISYHDYVYPTSAVTDEDDTAEAPQVFTLLGNVPNPFNPATVISYDLHRAVDVRLTVHDALGRVVDVLVDEHQSPGRYSVPFRGESSGIYFYRLEAGGMSKSGKMVMVK